MSARRARFIALMTATSMVIAACGSSTTPRAIPSVAPVEKVSTKPAPHVEPCGSGRATPANETGVSGEAITVGVIADVTGARAQFLSNWQAMQAFAAFCNSRGGIGGRRLDVKLFDSKVFNHRAAVTDSCASVFALVGSAAAFDGDGASIESDCGIPDVPALVAEPGHDRVPTVVAPLPNPQDLFLVGPERYLARTHPAAVRSAAMAYLDVGVTAVRASRAVEATRRIGYRYTVTDPIPALYGDQDVQALVGRLKSRSVRYLSFQGRVTDLAAFQTAIAAAGRPVDVVDAPPLFYDPSYLTAAGAAADGTYVVTQTTPFTDADTSPELRRYTEWLGRAVPGAVPTAYGARGWSAGLLFAEAARRVGTKLDRASVLAELRAIHAWDGNGIQVPADPGSGRASSCFAYMQVQSGSFRRAYPSRGFACPHDGWLRLNRNFRHL